MHLSLSIKDLKNCCCLLLILYNIEDVNTYTVSMQDTTKKIKRPPLDENTLYENVPQNLQSNQLRNRDAFFPLNTKMLRPQIPLYKSSKIPDYYDIPKLLQKRQKSHRNHIKKSLNMSAPKVKVPLVLNKMPLQRLSQKLNSPRQSSKHQHKKRKHSKSRKRERDKWFRTSTMKPHPSAENIVYTNVPKSKIPWSSKNNPGVAWGKYEPEWEWEQTNGLLKQKRAWNKWHRTRSSIGTSLSETLEKSIEENQPPSQISGLLVNLLQERNKTQQEQQKFLTSTMKPESSSENSGNTKVHESTLPWSSKDRPGMIRGKYEPEWEWEWAYDDFLGQKSAWNEWQRTSSSTGTSLSETLENPTEENQPASRITASLEDLPQERHEMQQKQQLIRTITMKPETSSEFIPYTNVPESTFRWSLKNRPGVTWGKYAPQWEREQAFKEFLKRKYEWHQISSSPTEENQPASRITDSLEELLQERNETQQKPKLFRTNIKKPETSSENTAYTNVLQSTLPWSVKERPGVTWGKYAPQWEWEEAFKEFLKRKRGGNEWPRTTSPTVTFLSDTFKTPTEENQTASRITDVFENSPQERNETHQKQKIFRTNIIKPETISENTAYTNIPESALPWSLRNRPGVAWGKYEPEWEWESANDDFLGQKSAWNEWHRTSSSTGTSLSETLENPTEENQPASRINGSLENVPQERNETQQKQQMIRTITIKPETSSEIVAYTNVPESTLPWSLKNRPGVTWGKYAPQWEREQAFKEFLKRKYEWHQISSSPTEENQPASRITDLLEELLQERNETQQKPKLFRTNIKKPETSSENTAYTNVLQSTLPWSVKERPGVTWGKYAPQWEWEEAFKEFLKRKRGGNEWPRTTSPTVTFLSDTFKTPTKENQTASRITDEFENSPQERNETHQKQKIFRTNIIKPETISENTAYTNIPESALPWSLKNRPGVAWGKYEPEWEWERTNGLLKQNRAWNKWHRTRSSTGTSLSETLEKSIEENQPPSQISGLLVNLLQERNKTQQKQQQFLTSTMKPESSSENTGNTKVPESTLPWSVKERPRVTWGKYAPQWEWEEAFKEFLKRKRAGNEWPRTTSPTVTFLSDTFKTSTEENQPASRITDVFENSPQERNETHQQQKIFRTNIMKPETSSENTAYSKLSESTLPWSLRNRPGVAWGKYEPEWEWEQAFKEFLKRKRVGNAWPRTSRPTVTFLSNTLKTPTEENQPASRITDLFEDLPQERNEMHQQQKIFRTNIMKPETSSENTAYSNVSESTLPWSLRNRPGVAWGKYEPEWEWEKAFKEFLKRKRAGNERPRTSSPTVTFSSDTVKTPTEENQPASRITDLFEDLPQERNEMHQQQKIFRTNIMKPETSSENTAYSKLSESTLPWSLRNRPGVAWGKYEPEWEWEKAFKEFLKRKRAGNERPRTSSPTVTFSSDTVKTPTEENQPASRITDLFEDLPQERNEMHQQQKIFRTNIMKPETSSENTAYSNVSESTLPWSLKDRPGVTWRKYAPQWELEQAFKKFLKRKKAGNERPRTSSPTVTFLSDTLKTPTKENTPASIRTDLIQDLPQERNERHQQQKIFRTNIMKPETSSENTAYSNVSESTLPWSLKDRPGVTWGKYAPQWEWEQAYKEFLKRNRAGNEGHQTGSSPTKEIQPASRITDSLEDLLPERNEVQQKQKIFRTNIIKPETSLENTAYTNVPESTLPWSLKSRPGVTWGKYAPQWEWEQAYKEFLKRKTAGNEGHQTGSSPTEEIQPASRITDSLEDLLRERNKVHQKLKLFRTNVMKPKTSSENTAYTNVPESTLPWSLKNRPGVTWGKYAPQWEWEQAFKDFLKRKYEGHQTGSSLTEENQPASRITDSLEDLLRERNKVHQKLKLFRTNVMKPKTSSENTAYTNVPESTLPWSLKNRPGVTWGKYAPQWEWEQAFKDFLKRKYEGHQTGSSLTEENQPASRITDSLENLLRERNEVHQKLKLFRTDAMKPKTSLENTAYTNVPESTLPWSLRNRPGVAWGKYEPEWEWERAYKKFLKRKKARNEWTGTSSSSLKNLSDRLKNPTEKNQAVSKIPKKMLQKLNKLSNNRGWITHGNNGKYQKFPLKGVWDKLNQINPKLTTHTREKQPAADILKLQRERNPIRKLWKLPQPAYFILNAPQYIDSHLEFQKNINNNLIIYHVDKNKNLEKPSTSTSTTEAPIKKKQEKPNLPWPWSQGQVRSPLLPQKQLLQKKWIIPPENTKQSHLQPNKNIKRKQTWYQTGAVPKYTKGNIPKHTIMPYINSNRQNLPKHFYKHNEQLMRKLAWDEWLRTSTTKSSQEKIRINPRQLTQKPRLREATEEIANITFTPPPESKWSEYEDRERKWAWDVFWYTSTLKTPPPWHKVANVPNGACVYSRNALPIFFNMFLNSYQFPIHPTIAPYSDGYYGSGLYVDD